MAKKFGASLTDRQVALARQFEKAGLTTYSQAVKAFERSNTTQIETWKQQLQGRRDTLDANKQNS